MKQVLQAHLIELIVATFVLACVLFFSVIPTDYRTVAPGYNNEVGDFVTIANSYPVEGSFHTTSVIVLNRTTILQRWVGEWETRVNVSEYPEYFDYVNLSDLRVSGYLSKDDSLNNSLVVGISRSQNEIDYSVSIMVYLTYTSLNPDTLELGDIILDVNGNTDIFTEVAQVGCNETAVFHALRGEEELYFNITRNEQANGSCIFGMSIRTFVDINDTNIDYVLHDSLTTGSSGGLMQSLYIFNQLTPNDITGGLQIAGTGTINSDGEVGPIGGIRQKIITSAMNGMDIFFVPYLSDNPSDNYITAVEVLSTLDSDMILVPVQTIDDAIAYLESRFGGAYDE